MVTGSLAVEVGNWSGPDQMDAMLPATTISTVAGLSSAQFYGSGVLGARYDAFTLEQRLDASAAQHLGGADASDAGVDYDATDDLLDFEITARQAESIARADQRAHCGVWSFEDSATGRRRFAAATVAGAWRWMLSRGRRERHLYEIIRAGRPSRLYFDLEYNLASNLEVDGPALTARVIHHAAWLLQRDYGIVLGARHFLVLDSTTAKKFSQHVVVHMRSEEDGATEVLFENNLHVGRFVRRLARAMLAVGGASALDVVKKQSAAAAAAAAPHKLGCFIDLGVYTRNRAFRTYLASKRGRDAVLAPLTSAPAPAPAPAGSSSPPNPALSALSSFPCELSSWRGEAEFFRDSLVATFPKNDDAARAHPLITAPEFDRFDRIVDATVAGARSRSGSGAAGGPRQAAAAGSGDDSLASPFPSLESHFGTVVLRSWGRGGSGGYVRSWRHLLPAAPLAVAGGAGAETTPPPRGRLILNVAGNRFCERVEREHKSNNISFVIDLQRRWWHQTCLDPDCAGYRSPSRSLPPSLALV